MERGNIVIHIGEILGDEVIYDLERDLGDHLGVYSACMHERTRHLMVVDFDPTEIRPSSIVHSLRKKGLRAKMIGL